MLKLTKKKRHIEPSFRHAVPSELALKHGESQNLILLLFLFLFCLFLQEVYI